MARTDGLAACCRRPAAGLCMAGLACLAAPAGADDFLRVETAEAARGAAGVEVIVVAGADGPVHGYAVGIVWPSEALTLRGLGVGGTHVATLAPEFVAPGVDNDLGVATLGVILDREDPYEARALEATKGDGARIVARLVFDVRDDAPGGLHPVRLIDGVGRPPVLNRYARRGESVTPELEPGGVVVRGGDVLTLDRVRAFPGASSRVEVYARGRHTEALAGYSVAFSFDCDALTVDEASLVGTDVQALFARQGGVDFFRTDVDTTLSGGRCRSRTAVIFEYPRPLEDITCPLPTLPPTEASGPPQTLVRYAIDVAPEASREAARDLRLDSLGETSLDSSFAVDRCPDAPLSVIPTTVDGKVWFRSGILVGTVVEGLEGAPLGGTRVTVRPGDRSARTDAEGRFRIEGIVPGEVDLLLEREAAYPRLVPGLRVDGGPEPTDAGALRLWSPPPGSGAPEAPFRRGDTNADGRVDISDGIAVLAYLFTGASPLLCEDAADTDDTGSLNLTDAVAIFHHLFTGGDPPAPPGPATCGDDPSDDELACPVFPGCS